MEYFQLTTQRRGQTAINWPQCLYCNICCFVSSTVAIFLVADTQLCKRLCLSILPSVCRSVCWSIRQHKSKSGKTSILEYFQLRTVTFPPLPTRLQLVAVYPALLQFTLHDMPPNFCTTFPLLFCLEVSSHKNCMN